MLTPEETKEIVDTAIAVCRRDVDAELIKLHEQDRANAWTEDRAKDIAKQAADLAVKQITDNFYMSVGKKTVATIGAMVVVSFIVFKDFVKKKLGLQ